MLTTRVAKDVLVALPRLWAVNLMLEARSTAAQTTKMLVTSEEFKKRVLSALLLAPLAIAAVYLSGWVADIVCAIVALLILREWRGVTSGSYPLYVFVLEAALVCALVFLIYAGMKTAALTLVLLLAGATFALTAINARLSWAIGGLVYALLFPLGTLLILQSGHLGFEAAVFICFVIWTTDVFAYFSGRMIGGPKLWPAISPKKTWAGFVGGTAGGLIAGFVLSKLLGLTWTPALAGVSLALSFAGHGGDLFESWVKRHFHKKDSGDLIPGHGGIMDRVDGLSAAFAAAMLYGALRTGLHDCAVGVLVW